MKQKITFKLITLTISLLIIISLSSCTKPRGTIENAIAIGFNNNQIYLLNTEGQELLLEGYDYIQEQFDEYMIVRQNNLYGYINSRGEEIIKPCFTLAYPMKENLAVVVKDNVYQIIDSSNNVLYVFPNDISSSSYFSDNRLVVCKNEKYGYLKYTPEKNNFELPETFDFDYALPFSEGFAVVGIETIIENNTGPNETSIRYNYLTLKNKLLFDEYLFETASSFHEGLGKVGVTETVTIAGVNSANKETGHTRTEDIYVYRYVNYKGEYLIDRINRSVLTTHYGTDASDGIITTAIYKYRDSSSVENDYYKSYTFYTISGLTIYDGCFQYTAKGINVFWPTNVLSLGNRHLFASAVQSVSWNYYLADESFEEFFTIDIDIKVEDLWVSDLATKYSTSPKMIRTILKTPFYMSNLKSIVYNDAKAILSICQVSLGDEGLYGMVMLTYNEQEDYQDSPTYGYHAKYIILPKYQRIVY